MAYREVTMLEIKEVLLLWLEGTAKKAIARQVGVDRNTVRSYIRAALKCGLSPGTCGGSLTDEQLAAVIERLRAPPAEPLRGDSWLRCERESAFIKDHLDKGVLLTKVHRLLKRKGVQVPYATLHRFAAKELNFGSAAPTIPVADCEPGAEVQLDTGWMTLLEPDLFGKRRRFRAWIFTSVYSRHRFVYPCFRETTATAIEACEAAWAYFGGVFHVVIPDNTKTIVQKADPLKPLIVEAFREYAQARGFHLDPTRTRSPKDKARVERSVPTAREDCFRGERLQTLADATRRANHWSLEEYGMRRHTRTQRLPRECFEAEEKPRLLPKPSEPYDIPLWCDPKVGPDQHAQVAKALYSLPRDFRRKKLRARADRSLVRFYFNNELVKTHPRQPPGGRSTDPNDFPPEQAAYALRDSAFLLRQAEAKGTAVGRFAKAVLDGPLPWVRMRQCFALLGLCRRFGDERVNQACELALAAEMHDVRRLERMLKLGPSAPKPQAPESNVVPLARFLRPAVQYGPSARIPRAAGPRRRQTMTTDVISPDLKAALRRLKLSGMLHTLPERLALARSQNMAYQDFLLLLLSDEISRRDGQAASLRAQRAHLDPSMQLETWDGTAKVTYDQMLLNELASLRFLEAHAHVAIVGPVGVGKTFIAHALGHIACRRGHSVLAQRGDLMLKTLRHARLDNTYEAELRKLIAVDLLIVDDFGLDRMDAAESRDAYEIFTERHRAGSMIVTSNRGPDEWLATFADPMRAQSAIDRFTGNAYDLIIEGESYRARQKPSLRGTAPAAAPAPTSKRKAGARSSSTEART